MVFAGKSFAVNEIYRFDMRGITTTGEYLKYRKEAILWIMINFKNWSYNNCRLLPEAFKPLEKDKRH